MADNRRAGALFGNTCTWISRQDALRHFAIFSGKTQSQQHIKPLHWYVACRLVLEGGFKPEEITPRPPFQIRKTKGAFELSHNRDAGKGGERTILGGLKTKNVDVVVTKSGIGPVMAVSCKGAIGAYRNLTNRMEEAVGDCTNLHMKNLTQRIEWSPSSPVFADAQRVSSRLPDLDYEPRIFL